MAIQCPKDMVLINSGGSVHPDEPAYCISKTEVSQMEDQQFWTVRQQSRYELVVKKKDGTTETMGGPRERPLMTQDVALINQGDVSWAQINPVFQPRRELAGPKKPAVLKTWQEAREYCQTTYPTGDLPTNREWEKACGDEDYCVAGWVINHSEHIYNIIYSHKDV